MNVLPSESGGIVLNRLIARLLKDQRFRFLVVGGINTAVGYGLYSALFLLFFHRYSWGYVLALIISTVLAMVVAFNLHRRCVFRVTGHVVRDFLAFAGVNAVSVTTNLVLLPLLVELAQFDPLLAQLGVLFATTLISYFGHREISFRRRRQTETEADD